MDLRTTVSPPPLLLLLLLLLAGLGAARHDDDHGSDNETSEESIGDTILRMNNGSSDFMLEGDLLIPKTRNAMRCLNKAYSCLWPKSATGSVDIPFLISEKYDASERREILEAMTDFRHKTCVRFVPRASQRAYVSIQPRYGCSSLLGRIGDKQVVSLQKFGCVQRGIIQHELMHVLGFYHEHTRSDRDRHVRINWENVNDYYIYNFEKKDANFLNTPYDYSSVMHYGRRAFGRYGAETITPIPDPTAPIGQRSGLSDIDVTRINRLYECWGYV